jgi:hypothetical protein
MSGPTTITATHRVTFFYTVAALQHKSQHYCHAVASGDSSGFDIDVRAGFSNVGFSLLPDEFFTMIAPFYKSTDTTFDKGILEERTGTTYVFKAQVNATVTPSGSAVAEPANGFCISGKSDDNRNFPKYIYEGAFGTVQKVSNIAGLSGASQELVNYFFNVLADAINKDAWAWEVSRANNLPLRWLAAVIDTNEKLRRIRHLK